MATSSSRDIWVMSMGGAPQAQPQVRLQHARLIVGAFKCRRIGINAIVTALEKSAVATCIKPASRMAMFHELFHSRMEI